MVRTSLARKREKVSMSQAAWLKKRWNRDQWPIADVAAGEDDLGDEAMPLGEDPAGDDRDEGLVGGCGEDRGEVR